MVVKREIGRHFAHRIAVAGVAQFPACSFESLILDIAYRGGVNSSEKLLV